MRCENLAVGYDGKAIAGNISFAVGRGECVLLCGANGTGKSTLLRTIAGLIPPVSGLVSSNDRIMIPARIPKVKGFTTKEFLSVSISRSSDWLGRLPINLRRRINDTLSEFGILSLADRDISTLSDGEFQKVCIASAVVRDAGLIILDEPTAFLDVDSRANIFELLGKQINSGRSVIFSSHDVHEAIEYSTRVFGLIDVPSGRQEAIFVDSGPSASRDLRHSVVSSCFTTFVG